MTFLVRRLNNSSTTLQTLRLKFSYFLVTFVLSSGLKTVTKKRQVPKRSEMQSEYKEKQEDTKGKLQSDIQCTFY